MSGGLTLVLYSFFWLAGFVPIIIPAPEPVPFEEVAAVLDEAAMHARGGPPYMIPAAGWHLAAALNAAGFHVVRAPADLRQLTL